MVETFNYIPCRGEVVWITLNPQSGHEQSGRRPAIVVSPKVYNAKVGLALFCPVTSAVKGYPFEVAVPDEFPVKGVILSDQVRSMDWRARNAEFICALPELTVAEVLAKLGTIIGK